MSMSRRLDESLTSMSHFIFLNLKSNVRSRTQNYFHSLVTMGHRCEWIDFEKPFSFKTLIELHKLRKHLRSARFVITCPSHILVMPCFLVFRKRILLDAGWPLWDGVIGSRKQFGFLGVNLIKIYIYDFLAFHFSSKVILESEQQVLHTSKSFLLPKRKLFALFTGFNEKRVENFGFDLEDSTNRSRSQFSVLFRGGDQKESGLEILSIALKGKVLPEDIQIRILSPGVDSYDFSPGTIKVGGYVVDRQLFNEFLNAHLVLGQMSQHERLNRTIPHKFFEAAYFGKAYLTAPLGPMKEFVDCQCVYAFNPSNTDDLYYKIIALANDFKLVKELGKSLNDWYRDYASSEILGKEFLAIAER